MSDNTLTTLKIIIIGSAGVGKTCLLHQFANNEFTHTRATVQPEPLKKKYQYNGRTVTLVLWDTAGQERFYSLPTNIFRDIQGAVLAYDVTDYKSFKDLHLWTSKLEEFYEGSDKYPIFTILGNKIDLEGREVSRKEGINFAKTHRALFLETSAKTSEGVDTAFDDLITKIMETPGLWKSNDHLSVVNLNQGRVAENPEWYQNCVC